LRNPEALGFPPGARFHQLLGDDHRTTRIVQRNLDALAKQENKQKKSG
jgi:hypothetical protein